MTQYNIILFWFMNDWGLYGRTYEMIARHLPSLPHVGRVVCILPPRMIWNGYYMFPFHLKREAPKLFLLTPNFRMIPKSLVPASLWSYFNEHIRDIFIQIALKILGFSNKNTIMWLFPPHGYINNLLKIIPHRLLITQIIDNHLHKTNESLEFQAFSDKQYNYLSQRSNVVITSSPQNFEYFSSINPSCYFLENAIDETFINSPSNMPCRNGGGRPRLGYVGWITKRTDLNLLAFIARERPGYDIVIVGPHENGINMKEFGLTELANVHIENAIPYKIVPKFLTTIDVCLIPHKDTLYSRSMNPLKIFQYLASGRPIVSTPIAGVERWEGMISIAENYREFVDKIDDAILKDSQTDSLRRIEAVSLDTWGIRVGQIYDILSKHIQDADTGDLLH